MDCLPGQRGAHRSPLRHDKGDKGDKDKVKGTTDRSDKEKQYSSVEILGVTKLRFSPDQLNVLNYQLAKMVSSHPWNCDESELGTECDGDGDGDTHNQDESSPGKQAESIVERLTQRLLCAVGNLDSRFSSKFLISLPDSKTTKNRTYLEYLVRLDTLSTPVLYPNDTPPSCEIQEFDVDSAFPGYARIRLRNKTSTNWAEFINASGYLRRDKIQERFVELLALAAAGTWPTSPLDCDESTQCAAPGKVLDAATLTHVLKTNPQQRVFYGAAASNLRFPDPRDFRLAIVDDPSGIRLRVGFLSPLLSGHDVEVRLVIAVGVDAWPRSCNFPARVHLAHAASLLYHRAANMGMYLCAIGTQSVVWQIQLPAAETIFLNHFGPNSTETTVLKILYAVLEDIHSKINEEKCKFSRKLISRRCVREALWSTLEEDCSNPLSVMLSWTSGNTSKHVLRLLDKLVGFLRCQLQTGFFFPNSNLLENLGNAMEEDYLVEANRIYMYMANLHNDSQKEINDPAFVRMCKFSELDFGLVSRWSDVIMGLMPPVATRSSRFSFASSGITSSNSRRNRESSVAYSQYTGRQLEYLGMLLKAMLDVRDNIAKVSNISLEYEPFTMAEDSVEDIIYLLVTMIEQAREYNMNHNKRSTKSVKYHTKTRSQFNAATAKLVEAVRKDRKRDQRDLSSMDFMQDSVLVKAVLRWLYKGLDQSKHNLAPVLRPYLNKLFVSSHEISWHLDSLREQRDEIQALGAFNRLVNTAEVSPASALIESVNKGWTWARNMLRLVQRSALRVVFVPDRGKVYRHILRLPSYENKATFEGMKSLQGTLKERKIDQDGKNQTLPNRRFHNFFNSGDSSSRTWRSIQENSNLSPSAILHNELKASSPMTETFRMTQQHGRRRCPDNLVHSLAALNKISILQELSHILLPEDRHDMLDTIHKLSKENKRQAALRRRCTLPPLHSSPPTTNASILSHPKSLLKKTSRKTSQPQTYTPTDENAAFHSDLPNPNDYCSNSDSSTENSSNNFELNEAMNEGFNLEELKDEMMLKTQKVLEEREKALARKIAKETLMGTTSQSLPLRVKEDGRNFLQENFKIKRLLQVEHLT